MVAGAHDWRSPLLDHVQCRQDRREFRIARRRFFSDNTPLVISPESAHLILITSCSRAIVKRNNDADSKSRDAESRRLRAKLVYR